MAGVQDNTTVVAQSGTHSKTLCLEAEALIKLALYLDQTIKARYIPGKRNVLTDIVSLPCRALARTMLASTTRVPFPAVPSDQCAPGTFGLQQQPRTSLQAQYVW